MQVNVDRFGDIESARNHARLEVDTVAEEVRGRFITVGGGQALEYQYAAAEAVAQQAGEPGPFPMLQADVDAGMAADIPSAATLVLNTKAAWESVGAGIRSIRLGAKRQIGLATTQAEVATIRNAAITQLRSIGN